jgi:hypothetical protein
MQVIFCIGISTIYSIVYSRLSGLGTLGMVLSLAILLGFADSKKKLVSRLG